MRIAVVKIINKKISLLINKLNTEVERNWLCIMFGALLCMAQRPVH